jgi:hypothetical protein
LPKAATARLIAVSVTVPGRDAYHLKTYLFVGNGFKLPRRKPVEPVWVKRLHKKTGKMRKISPVLAKRRKNVARRLAPLGFLEAVFHLLAEAQAAAE